MFNLGVPELVIIFIIILVLFGGKKIPELTKSVGQAIREFKNGINGVEKTKEKIVTKKEKNKEA